VSPFYGNIMLHIAYFMNFSRFYGNGGPSADKVNTNEQVAILGPEPGTWKVPALMWLVNKS
jgi:hypothetical protein